MTILPFVPRLETVAAVDVAIVVVAPDPFVPAEAPENPRPPDPGAVETRAVDVEFVNEIIPAAPPVPAVPEDVFAPPLPPCEAIPATVDEVTVTLPAAPPVEPFVETNS